MSIERHLAESRAHGAAGDDLRALDAAIRAVARRPDDVGALVNAVDCARRAGRLATALPWLERLCRLAPDHLPYRELRARAQAAALDAGDAPDATSGPRGGSR